MSRVFVAFAFALSIACCTPAHSQTSPAVSHCHADKISNTRGLGIRLGSGLIYRAFPGTGGRMSAWLPLDRVTVCRIGGGAVQITNLSKRGQTVKALRVNSLP